MAAPLTRPYSLYLDLVRFIAAVAVFIDHASAKVATGGVLWQLAPLGSDAVVIFFVLSGAVVAYAAREREGSGRTYAVNRLARLHSGAVPAVLLTVALDALGQWLDPSVYEIFPGVHAPHQLWRVLNCLLFTNETWFNDIQPGTNVAYWSLGYEAPYYLMFGLALFAPRRWAGWGAAAVLLLAGPSVAKLAPMWLLGVGVDAITRRRNLPARAGLWLWLLSGAALLACLLPIRTRAFLFTPMLADRAYALDMLHYYAVALAFALNLVGMHAAAPLLARWIEPSARPLRWLGGRTFALYLFHQPLIQLADAISHWPNTHWVTRTMVFVGVPLAVAALAELSERRKDDWRRFYARLLGVPPKSSPEPLR